MTSTDEILSLVSKTLSNMEILHQEFLSCGEDYNAVAIQESKEALLKQAEIFGCVETLQFMIATQLSTVSVDSAICSNNDTTQTNMQFQIDEYSSLTVSVDNDNCKSCSF